MRLKTSVVALSLFAGCFLPRVSFADSVVLTLTGDNSSPYTFTVDDTTTGVTTTSVALSCLSDQLSVSKGESWDATSVNVGALATEYASALNTVVPVASAGGVLTVKDLEEDAYLDSLYGTGFDGTTNSDIQDAIWDILDPGTASLDTAASEVLNLAKSTSETASFYDQFTFYYPDEPQGGWNKWNTEPQPFMGYTPMPATPEPSSLILMGTGLVGAAGAMRRRFKKA